ncbi:MAG: hypothetical protein AAGD06_15240 [Acidobacteriota bacterium]
MSSRLWDSGGFLSGFVDTAMGADPGSEDAPSEASAFLTRTMQWFSLSLVPAGALVLALLFRGHREAIHVVTTLHGFAFLLLAYSGLIQVTGVASWLGAAEGVPLASAVVFATLVCGYAYRALRRVYGEGPLRTAWKVVGVVVLTTAIWLGAALLWVTIGQRA